MNINDFFIVALFFTCFGVAISFLVPTLFKLFHALFNFLFKRPRYLKKTKF